MTRVIYLFAYLFFLNVSDLSVGEWHRLSEVWSIWRLEEVEHVDMIR